MASPPPPPGVLGWRYAATPFLWVRSHPAPGYPPLPPVPSWLGPQPPWGGEVAQGSCCGVFHAFRAPPLTSWLPLLLLLSLQLGHAGQQRLVLLWQLGKEGQHVPGGPLSGLLLFLREALQHQGDP